MAIIFILSSVPGEIADEAFNKVFIHLHPTVQNLLHIPLYGILQFLWLRSFFKLGKRRSGYFIICFGITIGYGFLDEINQRFVPGRYGSFEDMLLNVIGVCAGTVVFLMFRHVFPDWMEDKLP
jgi:VanZ family protein